MLGRNGGVFVEFGIKSFRFIPADALANGLANDVSILIVILKGRFSVQRMNTDHPTP